tara:strand:- start:42 stop:548 length:507 start_codon:yes stop_codon:yes gene_type:complete
MEIIKNFIKDKNLADAIKNLLLSEDFPYYYKDTVGYSTDTSDYKFGHLLYANNEQLSKHFTQIAMPILGRLNFNYFHRMMVNCYTKKPTEIITGMHTDMPEEHQVALYSVNTNNGYTLFENGDKVPSVENQLVLFDGSLKHCSVAQTDENLRINININLILDGICTSI